LIKSLGHYKVFVDAKYPQQHALASSKIAMKNVTQEHKLAAVVRE
jgi:hypothetical protein